MDREHQRRVLRFALSRVLDLKLKGETLRLAGNNEKYVVANVTHVLRISLCARVEKRGVETESGEGDADPECGELLGGSPRDRRQLGHRGRPADAIGGDFGEEEPQRR